MYFSRWQLLTNSKPKMLIGDSLCAMAAELEVTDDRCILEGQLYLIGMYYVMNIEYPQLCSCT